MAVVWSTNTQGVCYEVRTAGSSVRLYTDGVFHTQWNSKRPLAGHVWDLLFLSSCFFFTDKRKPPTPENALVLGVGGGAVINSLTHFYPDISVDGVELDKTHISIAKKYFIQNTKRVNLTHSCAKSFVFDAKPKKYDLIIEDLFFGSSEQGKFEARKAIDVDTEWLGGLIERLNTEGVLAINFESKRQCKNWLKPKRLKEVGVQSVYLLSQSNYENVIAVLSKNRKAKDLFNLNWRNLCASYPRGDTRSCEFQLSRL